MTQEELKDKISKDAMAFATYKGFSVDEYLNKDKLLGYIAGATAFAAQSQCGKVTEYKECPECGGRNVIVFDSDNDLCNDCGKWFPAVETKKESTPCICEQYREYLDEIIKLKKSASSTQELFPLLQYINKIDEALKQQQ